MKILDLTLHNFKGIKHFRLSTQGKDVNAFGDNATGKTTLADAFMWLLFDKDSVNRKDFQIKTLGSDGEPIHGLDHVVEATLEPENGKRITLKKVFKEKWTKKRGSATAEFTGHTTDYYLDGVPVQKKEYDTKIAEISDEQIFRLLTDPRYFNEVLHWQKRRELLLEVCGDVSDAEVIANKKELSRLADILGDRTIEQHRKVIQARRSEINKELERIPVRIDEVQRNLPEAVADVKTLQSEISAFRAREQDLLEQLARAEGGGAIAEKTKLLRKLEAELIDLKNQHHAKYETEIRAKQKALNAAQEEYHGLMASLSGMEKSLELRHEELASLGNKLTTLRARWHDINEQQFEFEQSDTCPTCGQALPQEQLEAAREKALAEFNRQKAEKLETISAEGKQFKARVDGIEVEIRQLRQKIAEARNRLEAVEAQVDGLKGELEMLLMGQSDYDKNPACVAKLKEVEEVEAEIERLKAGSYGAINSLKAELNSIREEKGEREQALSQIHTRDQGIKRIEELKAEERKLAAEFEELEQQLYLTEEFIRAKVRLLEDKINSKFKMARFKLFNVLVNGGIEECCETVYNGVPYSNLNNGARLNIGLDVINTLAEHYDFAPVVFIDNAESVVNILPTKGQQIRLIVSGTDKKLRIEIAEKKEKKEAV
jgi:DNA repair exonuclease SbcCD ATPase subunit